MKITYYERQVLDLASAIFCIANYADEDVADLFGDIATHIAMADRRDEIIDGSSAYVNSLMFNGAMSLRNVRNMFRTDYFAQRAPLAFIEIINPKYGSFKPELRGNISHDKVLAMLDAFNNVPWRQLFNNQLRPIAEDNRTNIIVLNGNGMVNNGEVNDYNTGFQALINFYIMPNLLALNLINEGYVQDVKDSILSKEYNEADEINVTGLNIEEVALNDFLRFITRPENVRHYASFKVILRIILECSSGKINTSIFPNLAKIIDSNEKILNADLFYKEVYAMIGFGHEKLTKAIASAYSVGFMYEQFSHMYGTLLLLSLITGTDDKNVISEITDIKYLNLSEKYREEMLNQVAAICKKLKSNMSPYSRLNALTNLNIEHAPSVVQISPAVGATTHLLSLSRCCNMLRGRGYASDLISFESIMMPILNDNYSTELTFLSEFDSVRLNNRYVLNIISAAKDKSRKYSFNDNDVIISTKAGFEAIELYDLSCEDISLFDFFDEAVVIPNIHNTIMRRVRKISKFDYDQKLKDSAKRFVEDINKETTELVSTNALLVKEYRNIPLRFILHDENLAWNPDRGQLVIYIKADPVNKDSSIYSGYRLNNHVNINGRYTAAYTFNITNLYMQNNMIGNAAVDNDVEYIIPYDNYRIINTGIFDLRPTLYTTIHDFKKALGTNLVLSNSHNAVFEAMSKLAKNEIDNYNSNLSQGLESIYINAANTSVEGLFTSLTNRTLCTGVPMITRVRRIRSTNCVDFNTLYNNLFRYLGARGTRDMHVCLLLALSVKYGYLAQVHLTSEEFNALYSNNTDDQHGRSLQAGNRNRTRQYLRYNRTVDSMLNNILLSDNRRINNNILVGINIKLLRLLVIGYNINMEWMVGDIAPGVHDFGLEKSVYVMNRIAEFVERGDYYRVLRTNNAELSEDQLAQIRLLLDSLLQHKRFIDAVDNTSQGYTKLRIVPEMAEAMLRTDNINSLFVLSTIIKSYNKRNDIISDLIKLYMKPELVDANNIGYINTATNLGNLNMMMNRMATIFNTNSEAELIAYVITDVLYGASAIVNVITGSAEERNILNNMCNDETYSAEEGIEDSDRLRGIATVICQLSNHTPEYYEQIIGTIYERADQYRRQLATNGDDNADEQGFVIHNGMDNIINNMTEEFLVTPYIVKHRFNDNNNLITIEGGTRVLRILSYIYAVINGHEPVNFYDIDIARNINSLTVMF